MPEHAIDAMPNGDSLLFRLEMQITRTSADGFGEQLIHESDRGRADVRCGITAGAVSAEGEVLNLDGGRDGIGPRLHFEVCTIELCQYFVRRRQFPPYSMPGRKRNRAFGVEVERVGGRDDDRATIQRYGYDEMASRPAFGKQRNRTWIGAAEVGTRDVGGRSGGHRNRLTRRHAWTMIDFPHFVAFRRAHSSRERTTIARPRNRASRRH